MPARVQFDIDALRTDVCAAVAEFDARVLDRDGAVGALRRWTAIAHAAQAAASLAAARVAECGPPPSAGARDASEFIAKETGTTSAKAKERIETGTRLQEHHRTRERAADGQLSPEQATAKAGVPTRLRRSRCCGNSSSAVASDALARRGSKTTTSTAMSTRRPSTPGSTRPNRSAIPTTT